LKFLLCLLISFLISSCYEVVNGQRILEYKSPYVGNTYKVPQLLAYYKGYEGDDYLNHFCTYKSDYILAEFGNKYISADDYFLIPTGNSLKVIDSFEIENDSFYYRLFSSNIKFVVVELENGKTAEMSELSFKLDVINKEEDMIATFLPKISSFNQINLSRYWYCVDSLKGQQYRYFDDNAQYVISSYKLSPHINISGIARGKRNNQEVSCIKINGKDLQAFIIFKNLLKDVHSSVKKYVYKNQNLCEVDENQKCLDDLKILYDEDTNNSVILNDDSIILPDRR